VVYRSIIVDSKPYFWDSTNAMLPILQYQRPDCGIRRIKGGFSFIPHRFLADGFLASVIPHELLLYFLLVLAGDRNGISFYSYDKICTLLQMNLERYIMARDGLNDKDLIAFDGTVFQVLDLPPKPFVGSKREDHERSQNRDAIARLIDQTTKNF